MNSRERVLKALNHEEPDRVPIDIGGTSCTTLVEPVYQKLLGKYHIKNKDYGIIHSAMRSININLRIPCDLSQGILKYYDYISKGEV